VAEQDGAVAEINRNIQMASDGSLQINAEMETVSSSIRLTGDSAHQVQAAVTLLREESEVLTNEIRLFLENVKAA
ncbi:MAG: methyl-accepting chemotaxis protein, partial [Pseudomonadota bacterium]